MRFDPIAVIEGCYAPEADDARWLEAIVAPLVRLAPEHGALGLTFDASDPSRPRPLHMTGARVREEALQVILQKFMSRSPDLNRVIYDPLASVELASRRLHHLAPGHAESERSFLSYFGCADCVGVFGLDTDHRGVVLLIPVAIGRRPPGPTTRALLSRVSAHLTSAIRLRRASVTARIAPDDAATEAVADPGGRIVHAAGEARSREALEAIAAAVKRKDRAQGRLRRTDPGEAAALWHGLIDGSWSLVDHVESDGRRRVLVRKNPPGVRDPKALTARERAVAAFAAMGRSNKYVAYLLGISPSSVSEHLASAQRKLGFQTRTELVRALALMVRCQAAEPPKA